MTCSRCLEHRKRVAQAIKSGSITKVSAETTAALRTFNNHMVARFGNKAVAKIKLKSE